MGSPPGGGQSCEASGCFEESGGRDLQQEDIECDKYCAIRQFLTFPELLSKRNVFAIIHLPHRFRLDGGVRLWGGLGGGAQLKTDRIIAI